MSKPKTDRRLNHIVFKVGVADRNEGVTGLPDVLNQ